MMCRLNKMEFHICTFYRRLRQSLRLMVGLPDYAAYCKHRQQCHPGEAIMSYEAFFRERQEARYGNKKGRIGCC